MYRSLVYLSGSLRLNGAIKAISAIMAITASSVRCIEPWSTFIGIIARYCPLWLVNGPLWLDVARYGLRTSY